MRTFVEIININMKDTYLDMNEQEIIDAIIAFNNDPEVQQLQSYYYNQTVPEILGISRREMSHSSFLAWLFTPTANHGLGTRPLFQLLELYLKCYREEHKTCLSEKLQSAILTRSVNIISADVTTEEYISTTKAKGRADIVIQCDVYIPDSEINRLRIVIENKIYSNEHDGQTQTYFDYYERQKVKDGTEHCMYIYLTPPSIEAAADCESFVHITYQDLLDHVLERLVSQSNISERTKFILNEYICCLSIPANEVDNENKTNLKTSILAIGMKEKELLERFWEKHNGLITMALHAKCFNGDKDAEELLKKVNNNSRDFSKYAINNSGHYCKNRMVEAVIMLYLDMYKDTTIEELKNIFPKELQGSLGVVKDQYEAISDKSRFFDAIHPATQEPFYICNQWGQLTDKFVDYVNENIDGITITKKI